MHLTDQQYDDLNQQLAEVEMEKSLKATHTPGPWAHQALAGNHDLAVYSESDGKDLALVRNFHEANATLIAAAPDLLAAVNGLLEIKYRIEGCADPECRTCKDTRAKLQAATDAIKKATQTL